MIDYTEVNRPLIYKDRLRLDDFKVDKLSETIEHQFYRRLSNERFMLQSVDAAKYALDIFNDAYYICTLFYMVEHPKLYLAKFRERIASRHNKQFITTATMTLVYLLLGEERQPPFSEQKEFVKLTKHFILENGDNAEVFSRLSNCVITGGTIRLKYRDPYTSERFKRRDIFEILHDEDYDYLCYKNIDYVIEEVTRRLPKEKAVQELLEFRKRQEDYFHEHGFMEYSIDDLNMWMIARNQIDDAINYNDNQENTFDVNVYDSETVDKEMDENEDRTTDNVCEYDKTYDYIFDPRVNPEEVKKALDKITTFDKHQHPFWFVFMKVLVYLQWIPSSINTKDVLAWASLQYDLNWTTKKQLSFSDIGGDKGDKNRSSNEKRRKKIKDTDITLWHTISKTEFRDIEKYRQFALLLKKTFVHVIIGDLEILDVTNFNEGKSRDRAKFMKTPKELINLGK